MKKPLEQNERVLRLPEVKQKTGLGRSSIYLKESEGNFPARISLGARSVGWLESEINTWINNRINSSRSTKAVSGGKSENSI